MHYWQSIWSYREFQKKDKMGIAEQSLKSEIELIEHVTEVKRMQILVTYFNLTEDEG